MLREHRLALLMKTGAADVRDYLDAGAECVHIATAAMTDPSVGLQIRADLASDSP